MNQPNTIHAFTIFGPPGCGKGTQAAMIKERLNFLHVSTGDIFRAAIARQDPLAMKAKELMERGELVPDGVISGMLMNELKAILDQSTGARGIILDGFPRTLGQAALLQELLEKLNLHFTGAISLRVPEELLVERLLKRAQIENRPDDTEDVVRERMRVYREKTQPLEDYFKQRNQLIEVDGVGSLEEVYERLIPIIQSW
ncbi:MAG: adenylate kinase [Candidatus Omnitrophica bacterium]|nr:adenylate kinase [Candidatus Omnitrophota bacterium]